MKRGQWKVGGKEGVEGERGSWEEEGGRHRQDEEIGVRRPESAVRSLSISFWLVHQRQDPLLAHLSTRSNTPPTAPIGLRFSLNPLHHH
jgi:hypothetical protein